MYNFKNEVYMNPVVHFEMPYKDAKRASTFYRKTFGWKMMEFGPEMGNYITAVTTDSDDKGRPTKPGSINGGLFSKTGEQKDACPSVVIGVSDIHNHMKMVTAAGGTILGEAVQIPGVGWYVSFLDTEGNKVSLLQPSDM